MQRQHLPRGIQSFRVNRNTAATSWASAPPPSRGLYYYFYCTNIMPAYLPIHIRIINICGYRCSGRQAGRFGFFSNIIQRDENESVPCVCEYIYIYIMHHTSRIILYNNSTCARRTGFLEIVSSTWTAQPAAQWRVLSAAHFPRPGRPKPLVVHRYYYNILLHVL